MEILISPHFVHKDRQTLMSLKYDILLNILSPINHTACMPPAYLVRGAPLGDDDVAGLLDDGDAVRVEQLPVSLPALTKLKLEAALAVEDLEWRER